MVFNQSAIDRGIFRADTLKKYHSEIDKNPSTNQDDIFTKPDKNKVADIKQGNYGKLSEKGFAPEETEITNEDFIIGKISPIQPTGDSNKVYKDSSEIFKSNVDGVIDRVHTGIYNADGYEMYNVRVRMERVPVIGDKFCLSPEHEVLTTEGWKEIDKVTLKDKVACLDNNLLVYDNPLEIYNFEHTGIMYEIKTENCSLMVSEEHRLYVKSNNIFKFVKPLEVSSSDCMIDINNNEKLITSVIYHEKNKYNKIHCLKVPSEIFLVRRLNSDFTFWTGNSNRHG